jgi:hypothetical protein
VLDAVCNPANHAMKLCGVWSDHLTGLAFLGQAPMEIRNHFQRSPGTDLPVLLIHLNWRGLSYIAGIQLFAADSALDIVPYIGGER